MQYNFLNIFVQVIASVRQKVDHCSYTIPNFEQLLLKARMTLIVREENWRHGIDPNQLQNNAVTVSAPPPPEPVQKGKIVIHMYCVHHFNNYYQ